MYKSKVLALLFLLGVTCGAAAIVSAQATGAAPAGQRVTGSAVPLAIKQEDVLRNIKGKYLSGADATLLNSYRIDFDVYAGSLASGPSTNAIINNALEVARKGLPASVIYSAPGKYMTILTASGTTVVLGVNPTATWQLVFREGVAGSRQVTALRADRAEAFKASQEGSLQAFIRLLSLSSDRELNGLKSRYESPYWVITWETGAVVNELYFSEKSWLCDKQSRRSSVGTSTLYYTDYRPEQGVMLPHKMEIRTDENVLFGTHLIKRWVLGEKLSDDFFTPEGVKVSGS